MSNILHIKDAYFELPEKCKDDIGCMVTMLDIHLQQNNCYGKSNCFTYEGGWR